MLSDKHIKLSYKEVLCKTIIGQSRLQFICFEVIEQRTIKDVYCFYVIHCYILSYIYIYIARGIIIMVIDEQEYM